MKNKLLLTALMGAGFFSISQAQQARLQVIHNSADAAAATVDVYADNVLLFDDVDFRTASPFIDVIPGSYMVGIAPSNSVDANDTIYAQNVTLTANETYVAVANGIVSTMGYSPSQPFGIDIYAMGREVADQAGNTDILINHGGTDAPEVKVVNVTDPLNVDNSNVLVPSASYQDFAGYLELPTADYNIQIRTMDNSTVQEYSAPLNTLNLNDAAIVVVASGFLNPANNSGGASFGLWAALPTGGALVELPQVATSTARLQIIHNCAAVDASSVDIYANGDKLFNEVDFRTATEFFDVPAGVALSVDITPPNSMDNSGSLYNQTITATAGDKFIAVASGTIGSGTYNPATPFSIELFAGAMEMAGNANETDVLVYHGATDAPTVDVVEQSAGLLVDDISYSEFDGYLNLATLDYALDVTDETGANVVASYEAPLQTLGLDGAAITVLASGFLDPSDNNNGADFGLWAALSSGGALVELPLIDNSSLEEETINNLDFVVFPNPTAKEINISFNSDVNESIEVTLTSTNGQEVMKEKLEIVKGENLIQLTNSDLGKGIYILHLNSDTVAASQRIQVLK